LSDGVEKTGVSWLKISEKWSEGAVATAKQNYLSLREREEATEREEEKSRLTKTKAGVEATAWRSIEGAIEKFYFFLEWKEGQIRNRGGECLLEHSQNGGKK